MILPVLALLICGCAQRPEEKARLSEEMILKLEAMLDPFLNDGGSLPVIETVDGNSEWTVISGNARIEDGRIYKTENAAEYEPVQLQASLNGIPDEHVFTDLLLLDACTANVISYFSEVTDEPETMKLAYTYNGVEWFSLNGGHAVLKAETGTGRLRDPSLLRKKDGTFCVLATQGYDTDSVYVFDSTDLTSFSGERLLKVNSAPLSEKQAWAPEGFYDRREGSYVLYWSSVADGGMFFSMSEDLLSVSEPQPLLDAGFEVIDGTIIKQEDRYTIILKDERQPMEDYSQLFAGYSETGWKDFGSFTSPISGHQSEGPMVIRDPENEGYYIFYDDYTRYMFRSLYTQDPFGRYFDDVADNILSIPLEAPAHSHAIPVTQKELERIIAFWQ